MFDPAKQEILRVILVLKSGTHNYIYIRSDLPKFPCYVKPRHARHCLVRDYEIYITPGLLKKLYCLGRVGFHEHLVPELFKDRLADIDKHLFIIDE
jgi:hypothetical protein